MYMPASGQAAILATTREVQVPGILQAIFEP